jgi:hypothetical protein
MINYASNIIIILIVVTFVSHRSIQYTTRMWNWSSATYTNSNIHKHAQKLSGVSAQEICVSTNVNAQWSLSNLM